MMADTLSLLRKSTSRVIVPSGLEGLPEVAAQAQKFVEQLPSAFWNIPPRTALSSDAEYVGLVISILKKRAGRRGVECALSLVNSLEKMNADKISGRADTCPDEDA